MKIYMPLKTKKPMPIRYPERSVFFLLSFYFLFLSISYMRTEIIELIKLIKLNCAKLSEKAKINKIVLFLTLHVDYLNCS